MAELNVLGAAEVAALLHVHPVTVSNWKAQGVLPPPDAQLASGPVWRTSTITSWGVRAGRLHLCADGQPHHPADNECQHSTAAG